MAGPQHTPAEAFVSTWLQRAGAWRELFESAELAGLSVADVLDVVLLPFAHLGPDDAYELDALVHDPRIGGPLFALVETFGLERARSIVAEADHGDLLEDLGILHANELAVRKVERAVDERQPVSEVYALLTEVSGPRNVALLQRLAARYPAEALLDLPRAIPDGHRAVLQAACGRARSALSAFEHHRTHLEPGAVLDLLERFWGQARPPGDERDAMLGLLARLSEAEEGSFARAVGFASESGPAAWWLPILREGGLRASQAALALHEQGTGGVQVAQALREAGYRDADVFRALLENGFGPTGTLTLLRDAGWQSHALVAALAARDALATEARDHLRTLGVPAESQRRLLAAHWPKDVVDLVLEDGSTVAWLGPGEP